MAKKFCPRCNSNEHLKFVGGRRCCSCCGLDADYMSPAVSEDYTSTRPLSQSQTVVKPDIHDDADRTFAGYGSVYGGMVDSNVTLWKAISIASIMASLLIMFLATFYWTAELKFDDGTVIVTTIFQWYLDSGSVLKVVIPCALALFMTFFRPRWLAAVYFITGFVYLPDGATVSGDYFAGIFAFFIGFFIGYALYKWDTTAYPRGRGGPFYKAFWLNIRQKDRRPRDSESVNE